jgi:hypothetical protein
MPYIAAQQRTELDGSIDQLAEGIVRLAQEQQADGAIAGLLNYACTRLALTVARQRFGPMRYWVVALITGTFKNIADEFYRRIGEPYENRQMARNGDVDLYQAYATEIEGRS